MIYSYEDFLNLSEEEKQDILSKSSPIPGIVDGTLIPIANQPYIVYQEKLIKLDIPEPNPEIEEAIKNAI